MNVTELNAGLLKLVSDKKQPDLSLRQLCTLIHAVQNEGKSVLDFADALNISKPAVTRCLDRLGELELAKRVVDKKDRRKICVHATTKGVQLLHRLTS